MKAAGGVILAVGGLIAALLFLPKKAHAAPAPHAPNPRAPNGEPMPTQEELDAAKEAQYAQTLINQAFGACIEPATCNVSFVKQKVNQLRAEKWVHPDVKAKAYKAANDLEAMAQDATDYQQALKAAQGAG